MVTSDASHSQQHLGQFPGPDAHLRLDEKLEILDSYTHTVLHQFPRLENHLLCASLRASVTHLTRLKTIAWKRRQKSAALFDLDVELEVVRSLIRKAHRSRYINDKRLGIWMEHVNVIGRIVGRWIQNEEAKKPKKIRN